jgi:hypothetical protein
MKNGANAESGEGGESGDFKKYSELTSKIDIIFSCINLRRI